MTNWRRVQGSQEVKPEEFDTTSSPSVVYQRRNIQRITTDDGELWEYDERTMTHEEFAVLLSQRDTEQLEHDITDMQMALVELYEMIGG